MFILYFIGLTDTIRQNLHCLVIPCNPASFRPLKNLLMNQNFPIIQSKQLIWECSRDKGCLRTGYSPK